MTCIIRRREAVVARDILEERDYVPTIFNREEDIASLQEREPILG
jgi:hypothetical protein